MQLDGGLSEPVRGSCDLMGIPSVRRDAARRSLVRHRPVRFAAFGRRVKMLVIFVEMLATRGRGLAGRQTER